MKFRGFAIVLALVLATVPAFAHDGADHIKGTVTSVANESITIETTDKQSKTVAFDQTTKFQKSGKAATSKDLKAGDRVVIDIHKMNGKLHGTLVRFGAGKAKAAQQDKPHNDKH